MDSSSRSRPVDTGPQVGMGLRPAELRLAVGGRREVRRPADGDRPGALLRADGGRQEAPRREVDRRQVVDGARLGAARREVGRRGLPRQVADGGRPGVVRQEVLRLAADGGRRVARRPPVLPEVHRPVVAGGRRVACRPLVLPEVLRQVADGGLQGERRPADGARPVVHPAARRQVDGAHRPVATVRHPAGTALHLVRVIPLVTLPARDTPVVHLRARAVGPCSRLATPSPSLGSASKPTPGRYSPPSSLG